MTITAQLLNRGESATLTKATARYLIASDVLAEIDTGNKVRTWWHANAPPHASGWIASDFSIEQVSEQPPRWFATVDYEQPEWEKQGGATIDYSFDIGTQNVLIKKSIATVATYDVSAVVAGPAPNKGLINVQHDGTIKGVERTISVSQFTYGLQFEGYIPDVYQTKVENLVGFVNTDTFRTRAIGEVMLLGASGRTAIDRNGNLSSSIQLNFARKKNRTSVVVAGINGGTGFAVKGWEYLWVRYAQKADDTAGDMIQTPKYAVIEQIEEQGALTPVLSVP